MLQIDVRDFQSIEKTSVKIDGFTALVGRSNIGKSALVRAVKAALTGSPGTAFVRHGPHCFRKVKGSKTCKCFASVHLRTEGFDLLWEKGDAINQYTFNGTTYSKADRGTPEFLQDSFLPVRVGDQQTLLQVSDQFSPIFLLNQSGTVIADVLSDVARLDRINVAMRNAEKDRREASSTRKIREQDVADLTQRLTQFDTLDDVAAQAAQVENRLSLMDEMRAKLKKIEGFLVNGAAIGLRIRTLQIAANVQVPESTPVVAQGDKLTQLERFRSRVAERTADIQTLSGVESLFIPASTELTTAELTRLDSFQKRYLERHRFVDNLSDVELLPDLSAAHVTMLRESAARLDGWARKLQVYRGLFDSYKAVQSTQTLDSAPMSEVSSKVVTLTRFQERLAAITSAVQATEDLCKQTDAEAAAIQAEWDALGVCPTCAQKMSPSDHQKAKHAPRHRLSGKAERAQ